MKENNKGSMIILTVIGIATLLVAVIGATFAYFTVQIQGNVTETTVQVTSSTMLVTFEKQNDLSYTESIPGRPLNTESNKLRFSLTSDTELGTATKYEVYLVIDSNDFENNPTTNTPELVYIMTQTEHTTNEPSSVANGTVGSPGVGVLNSKENITINQEGVDPYNIDVGLIPAVSYKLEDNTAEEDKTRIKIADGHLASHGNKDSWELEVWLKETQEQQNYNQGKTLNAHIDIVVTDSFVSNEQQVTTP